VMAFLTCCSFHGITLPLGCFLFTFIFRTFFGIFYIFLKHVDDCAFPFVFFYEGTALPTKYGASIQCWRFKLSFKQKISLLLSMSVYNSSINISN
jgi:hypothetical protein